MIEDSVRLLTKLLTAEAPVDSDHFALDGQTVYVMDDELSTDLAISESFYEGDRRPAQERVENDFVHQFWSLVDSLRSTWGPPESQTYPVPRDRFPMTDDEPKSFEEDMFWRGAVALAYWRRSGRVAFVCVEHQDNELPYTLMIGVKPDGTYAV